MSTQITKKVKMKDLLKRLNTQKFDFISICRKLNLINSNISDMLDVAQNIDELSDELSEKALLEELGIPEDMDISVYDFYKKVDNIDDDDEEEVENKLLDNLSLKEKINVIKYFNKELTK